MGSLVQEIIVAASSMIFVCQQMSLGTTSRNINSTSDHLQLHQQHVRVIPDNGISQQQNFADNCVGNMVQERGQGFYSSSETISWYGDQCNNRNNINNNDDIKQRKRKGLAELNRRSKINDGSQGISAKNYDIVELDAADLLAKYTHYCQVCGKGFKRDANLRMHMRAHGDEYKTSAALTNPMKNSEGSATVMGNGSTKSLPKKYSCPHEGCRWNRKHAKFQPLKSMICVKNHYKRSHCPKIYVCKRCNRKQFSVLSDLRTHEKHCGDVKWQCSCGTTFSRKDKLMGHVALFVGHIPVATNSITKPGKLEHQATTMQAIIYVLCCNAVMFQSIVYIHPSLSREFVGFSTKVDESTIRHIWKRAREFFSKIKEQSLVYLIKNRKVRVGLRPYMPDGKPIIGCVPSLLNLLLAIGHERGQLSIALGTAKMVVDIALGNPSHVDNSPFATQKSMLLVQCAKEKEGEHYGRVSWSKSQATGWILLLQVKICIQLVTVIFNFSA
ncbi:hypothetical protein DITRI_Ditri14bG0052800 [Diplodiscus trichospermus]